LASIHRPIPVGRFRPNSCARIPRAVLLGSGIPLFGTLDAGIPLTRNAIRTLKAGFTRSDYAIHR